MMSVPAWLYDWFMAPLEALGLRAHRRRLMRGLSGRVLELGAGTGANARANPSPAVAVDRNLAFLKRARARGLRAEAVCADARALPFRDGAFDQAVESLVFCSLPEPERCLAELSRVVKPGGQLRMLDHVRARGGWARFQRALSPAWLALTGECHLDRDVTAMIERTGLRVERLEVHLAGWLQRAEVRTPDR